MKTAEPQAEPLLQEIVLAIVLLATVVQIVKSPRIRFLIQDRKQVMAKK